MVGHKIQAQLQKISSHTGDPENGVELLNRRLEELHRMNARRLSEKGKKSNERAAQRIYAFQKDADRIGAAKLFLKDSQRRWEVVIASNPHRMSNRSVWSTPESKATYIKVSQRTSSGAKKTSRCDTRSARSQQLHGELPLGPRVKFRASLSARRRESSACLVSCTQRGTHKTEGKRPQSAPLTPLFGAQNSPPGRRLWSVSRSYRELQLQVNAIGSGSCSSNAYANSLLSSRPATTCTRFNPTPRASVTIRRSAEDDQTKNLTTMRDAVLQSCLSDIKTRSKQLQQKIRLFCLNTAQFVSDCLLRTGFDNPRELSDLQY
ncbi:hypothetical protein D915_001150 [Fasciola hepatica]|uniref:Uncharacterized protein n=1 Tax=Fasciola hepatica TaxID=6192 RepID=A0A4E0RGX1_FASHE|nr:hypothetical protein D915_001150 [Fasciola hepatica]